MDSVSLTAPGWSESIQATILLVEVRPRLSFPVHPSTHWPASQPGFPGPVRFVSGSHTYSGPHSNHSLSSLLYLALAGAPAIEATPAPKVHTVYCEAKCRNKKHRAAR